MKKIKSIYAGLIATCISGITLSSCNNYLDVNDNPNFPTKTTIEALLPSACVSTVAQLGLNGTLLGTMWLQHTTQGNTTNQYNTTVNYNISVSSYNAFFTNAYINTLPDLKDIIQMSEEENAWNFWLVSKILMAYNFHILADLYEDIPFNEALDIDTYPYPKYDDGKTVVYPGILTMLDEALAKKAEAKNASNPTMGKYDMYMGGNIDKWTSFAKNLKLKILMRDFNANKSKIQELLTENDFLKEDCAITSFEDAANKGNPFYEYNIRQLNTKENIRACHTLCEYLLTYGDPRIANIYQLTTAATDKINEGEILTDKEKYEGLPCGEKPNTSIIVLKESSRYLQAYDDPVYLMNQAEIFFLIAEAYARLGDIDKAKENYENGVTAAFDRWNNTAGKAEDFLKDGGAYSFKSETTESMLKCIMIQKWISYAKANSLDGWFDRNRTGYPAISSVAKVRISAKPQERTLTPGYELGTFVDPDASTLPSGQYPRRLLIPNASSQYNPNAPVTKSLDEPMWWQVAKGK
jgi:hypothetical protein